MELSTYLHIFARRKGIILGLSLLLAAGFGLFRAWFSPTLSASALLRLQFATFSSPSSAQLSYADRLTNTFIEVAQSGPVVAELRDRLGLNREQPAGIEVVALPATELVRITVSDPDPYLARDAANTLADILMDKEQVREGRISVIDPAVLPHPASFLDHAIFVLLGAAIGFSLGLGLAFAVDSLDRRIYTSEALAQISRQPILAQVECWRGAKGTVVAPPDHQTAFRRLCAYLLAGRAASGGKTLLVTSALPGEGKTSVALNLAICLAQSGQTTLLIEANPDHPNLEAALALDPAAGPAPQKTTWPGLCVLPSRAVPAPPDERLGNLKRAFDYLLIDTPAFLGSAEAALFAPWVDGILWVVRRRFASRAVLEQTARQLQALPAPVLGVIENQVTEKLPGRYQRSGRGAQPDTPAAPIESAPSKVVTYSQDARRHKAGAQGR